MTELGREMIFSERALKKDDKDLCEKMRPKQSDKKPQPRRERESTL